MQGPVIGTGEAISMVPRLLHVPLNVDTDVYNVIENQPVGTIRMASRFANFLGVPEPPPVSEQQAAAECRAGRRLLRYQASRSFEPESKRTTWRSVRGRLNGVALM
jgi:hypothetical protein